MSLYQEFLLLERNVVNQEDIVPVIQDLQSRAHNENAKKWLATTLRNWVIRDFKPVQKFQDLPDHTKQQYIAKLPWLQRAIGQGSELFVLNFRAPAAMRWIEKMQHVVDYFNAHPEERLDRVSVEQAEKAAEQWTDRLSRQKAKDEDATGVKDIMDFEDGYRWVSVQSKAALEREGQLMKHCVGSYASQVEEGKQHIYSLRDANNKPHITMELSADEKEVAQVKGASNSAPKKIYLPYLGSLFTKLKLKPTRWGLRDLQRISPSIIEVNGRLVDLAHLAGTLEGDLIFDTSAHGEHAEVETGAIGIGDGRDLTINGKFYLRDSSNEGATSATQHVVMKFNKLVVHGDMFVAVYEDLILPTQLMVDGHCDLHHVTGVVKMPEKLAVARDLVLPRYFDKLPEKFLVRGKIYVPKRWEGKLNIPDGASAGGVEYY